MIDKEELATDTFVYRFALPEEDKTLGHLTCEYLQFEATLGGQKLQRYYHPLSKVTDTGYVDLLIKVYLRNMEFQQGGLFTQHVDKMKVGDNSMRITGIGGDVAYLGGSEFRIREEDGGELIDKRIKRVGMIAAGSGISPMFQLVQTVADSRGDNTSLSLIYSSRTPVRNMANLFRNLSNKTLAFSTI